MPAANTRGHDLRKFDSSVPKYLDKLCNGDPIESIGLGIYNFSISFGRIRSINAMLKVAFFLEGRTYEWEEGPTAIPVWMIIGQVPERFELPTPFVLRMWLASGDYVDFYTDENPYEATTIEIMGDGVTMLDVF